MDIQNKLNTGLGKTGICPKCGASDGVRRSSDIWGSYIECIHCGYNEDDKPQTKEINVAEIENVMKEGGR